jgi:LmbE family N-acetylglucosaminyl deacetylase
VAATVSARSVLVVAPHYDDEVLGCGGLLLQLQASGAALRVLFLTDGAGGVESIADRVAYAATRRAEAQRVGEILGLAGADHLDLPDGQLANRSAEIAAAVRRALLSSRPDLLLVPSPLEVTDDHRAAFAAVHAVLHAERGAELAPILPGLRVLLYEVNHPAHPDLLVDVSAELPRFTAAMAAYASQEERHPYGAAGLGLRSFRAVTLGPTVRGAEGYRRLAPEDFSTRSLAGLVTALGGVPTLHAAPTGPLVSVVVRTKDRPELLAEALRSLDRGTYRHVEIVLVNDGGVSPSPPEIALPLVRVELPHNRGRAAAANAGVAAASGEYIAFLDDDDLVEPEHLATLVGMVAAADVRVAYTDAAVGVYELAPGSGWCCRERRLPYSRDFDGERLLVDNYIPFHTLLIARELLAAVGPFDEGLPFFEDWDFLIRLAAQAPFHHLAQVTCEYRHFRGSGHHVLGEQPRGRADFLDVKARVLAKHGQRLVPAVLARIVDELRAEAVQASEAARGLAADNAELRREWHGLTADYHRLRGEAAALRGDRERMESEVRAAGAAALAHREDAGLLRAEMAKRDVEIQRLYEQERELRTHATGLGADLEGRLAQEKLLYAEIARLHELIGRMEATRAWRLHRWLERRR